MDLFMVIRFVDLFVLLGYYNLIQGITFYAGGIPTEEYLIDLKNKNEEESFVRVDFINLGGIF